MIGFLGIPTLGYHIRMSYEDGNLREIWTYLYALLIVMVALEFWGAAIRKRLSKGVVAKEEVSKKDTVMELHSKRPRSTMLRVSMLAGVFVVALSWFSEKQWGSDLSASQRERNLDRFLQEIVPHPVRKNDDWGEFVPWVEEKVVPEGLDALHRTFHLGTSAVLLAAAFMMMALPFSSRAMAGEKMFGVWQGRSGLLWLRKMGGRLARVLAVVGRSIPEYVLAFLLLQIFGPTAWALILALAIHNAGILARLGGEVMENHRCPGAEVAAATEQVGRVPTRGAGWPVLLTGC